MKTKSNLLVAVFLITIVLLSACSKSASPASVSPSSKIPKATSHDPVTLKVYDQLFTDEQWNKLIVAPTKAKFPYVTLERIVPTAANATNLDQLNNLIASGQTPDILLRYIAGTGDLNNLDLPTDLTPLVKKHNADISQIEPSITKSITEYGKTGTVDKANPFVALPLYSNFQVLVYNKDIFDKFATGYPTDGMDYKNYLELARRLTRIDSGVQYYGGALNWNFMQAQLSLGFVDPVAKKSIVTNNDYQTIFETGKQFFNIPGITFQALIQQNKYMNMFYKDRTVATMPVYIKNLVGDMSQNSNMNWDIVTMPTFTDNPKAGNSMIDFHAAYITKSSKHADDAFDVISNLALSKDAQTLFARNGLQTILKDDGIKKEFAADIPIFKGKNMDVFEKSKLASFRITTKYDLKANQYVAAAFSQVINGTKDINTALSEADQQINKDIAADN